MAASCANLRRDERINALSIHWSAQMTVIRKRCKGKSILELNMAALKWGWAAVFIFLFVSLILTCKCDSAENSNGSVRDREVGRSAAQAASPGETQRAEDSSNEEVQPGEQQWHTTEFEINDALEDNKADTGVNDFPGDSKSFTPPPVKDSFQEELVIRPLHTGDIYASFQFRTQLDADFLQEGEKGCL